jgi:acetolactate synthase-1/2/3 large subunit
MEMSGANALIEALRREKTQVVFGLPGGVIMPVYDVFYKMRDLPPELAIRHVLARHEQSAAHMADGYARASGRVGVCMSTSGPGATNLVTGIATAFMDSSPVIAITGQVARPFIGKDAFQEVDIIGVAASVTKYTFQAKKAA